MANQQLRDFTESSVYKLLAPGVLAVLNGILGWQFIQMNSRLDKLDAFLATAQADKATTELRLRSLEALVPERGTAIKQLQEKTLLLEFRIQDIETREMRAGRRMP